jgi:hypothetical protein
VRLLDRALGTLSQELADVLFEAEAHGRVR